VKYLILAITAPLVIISDQWTKHLIVKHFHLGETLTLIDGFFNFTYVQNKGAAFSFLNDAPPAFREPFFMIVPMIILGALAFFYYKLPDDRKLTALSMSLIAGGAVGNLIDRIQLGYVVDFLHFHWKNVYHYPMFNVADSCIVVGVGYLFIESLFKKTPTAAK
jgi:signal peptidase II